MINSWSLNPAGSLALVNNYADNYQKIASITYINATKVAKNPKVLILSIKLSSPMMCSSSAHLWSVRTQKYKKALALIETSVEWKKKAHLSLWRHRWGKEAATGYAPALWKLLPALLSRLLAYKTCHFGSAQVLVVLESDWTYPSPTLNTELMFLRTSCRLGHHRAFPSSPRVSSSMGAHPASQHLVRLLLSIHGCLSGSEGELSEWMLKAV